MSVVTTLAADRWTRNTGATPVGHYESKVLAMKKHCVIGTVCATHEESSVAKRFHCSFSFNSESESEFSIGYTLHASRMV